jgi:hypothetical protein
MKTHMDVLVLESLVISKAVAAAASDPRAAALLQA